MQHLLVPSAVLFSCGGMPPVWMGCYRALSVVMLLRGSISYCRGKPVCEQKSDGDARARASRAESSSAQRHAARCRQ